VKNKISKGELFSENIEAGFLEIFKPQVSHMFKKLSTMNPELEKEWKDLFAKNIILYIDGFLEEMSDELKIAYNRDIRIDNLKKYIESIDK
jgi:hypothetical protein